MNKEFSLKTLIDDLLTGLDGPELSWDIKIDAFDGRFNVSFPIKFYGKRKNWLDSKIREVAQKHGLAISEHHFKSDHDMILEGTFGDVRLPRI